MRARLSRQPKGAHWQSACHLGTTSVNPLVACRDSAPTRPSPEEEVADTSGDESSATSTEESDETEQSEAGDSNPATGTPECATPLNVAVYVRDWSFNGGGRFVQAKPGSSVPSNGVPLVDACLGLLVRYRRNAAQGWSMDNTAFLLIVQCRTVEEAEAFALHAGFWYAPIDLVWWPTPWSCLTLALVPAQAP